MASSSADPAGSPRRAAVVYNPTKVDRARLSPLVTSGQTEAGWEETVWFETSPDDDGAQAAVEARAADPAVVLVAGGDGTVRAVAERLAGTGIALALVPVGTGNLLARALGIPVNSLPRAVRAAFAGTARELDVGRAALRHEDGSVTSHRFMVMAGIGLDARMAAGTSAVLKKRLGWVAYVDPIGRSILAGVRFAVHFRLDGGRTHSTRAHTIIVGNCGTLTGGVLLIPDARPDDGILDTVILRPRGFIGWAQIGARLSFARFLHRTVPGRLLRQAVRPAYAIRYDRARRIDVTFNSPQEVELDGDSFGHITAAKITIEPGALRIIGDGSAGSRPSN